MDQRRINHGSTWINVDQASSACPLQHVAAVLTHGSCVMRPTLQASGVLAHGSCVRRQTHGSCVMRQTHGSCVRRPRARRQASGVHVPCVRRQASTSHASGVRRPRPMRQASDSWLMAHASDSWLMRQASHASGVRRQTPRPSFSPFSRRPLSVMTTTQRRHFPMLPPSDLRPLSCMAWGNRVVLPPSYSSTGTNKNSGRRS